MSYLCFQHFVLSISIFFLLHTCKVNYDALCDLEVIAYRAMRMCDILGSAGKKQYLYLAIV